MGILSDLFSKTRANYINSLTGDKQENFSDNPYLKMYQKQINKATSALDKNKQMELNTLYSERYILDKDIGQKDEKRPEGWTGLYNINEMEKAGFSPKETNVSSADIHSTAIEGVRYNPKSKNLYVKFVNGNNKEYLYPNVPQETVREYIKAPSKGIYHQTVIQGYAVPKDEAIKLRLKWRNK